MKSVFLWLTCAADRLTCDVNSGTHFGLPSPVVHKRKQNGEISVLMSPLEESLVETESEKLSCELVKVVNMFLNFHHMTP